MQSEGRISNAACIRGKHTSPTAFSRLLHVTAHGMSACKSNSCQALSPYSYADLHAWLLPEDLWLSEMVGASAVQHASEVALLHSQHLSRSLQTICTAACDAAPLPRCPTPQYIPAPIAAFRHAVLWLLQSSVTVQSANRRLVREGFVGGYSAQHGLLNRHSRSLPCCQKYYCVQPHLSSAYL